MYLPPTKRQRREKPQCWTDCESLWITTTPPSIIISSPWIETISTTTTTLTSSHDELFWERLDKEIIQKYWNKTPITTISTTTPRPWFRQRISIGYNQCTKVLIQSIKPESCVVPLLVLLSDTTINKNSPTTFHSSTTSLPWNWIPAMCYERNIPLYLFASSSSSSSSTTTKKKNNNNNNNNNSNSNKLAQLFHLKQASMLVIVSRPTSSTTNSNSNSNSTTTTKEERFHQDVDSFVQYVCKKFIRPLKLTPPMIFPTTTTTTTNKHTRMQRISI